MCVRSILRPVYYDQHKITVHPYCGSDSHADNTAVVLASINRERIGLELGMIKLLFVP